MCRFVTSVNCTFEVTGFISSKCAVGHTVGNFNCSVSCLLDTEHIFLQNDQCNSILKFDLKRINEDCIILSLCESDNTVSPHLLPKSSTCAMVILPVTCYLSAINVISFTILWFK